MCGRYVQPDVAAIERAWHIGRHNLTRHFIDAIRYNVTPGAFVAALRRDGEGGLELCDLRWGLVPSWAGSAESGLKTINARSETVATSGAYRQAFRKRRCLVPAMGWYEWQLLGSRRKQPWYFCSRDGRLLAFAAIWERRQQSAVEALESVSILTRPANEDTAPVHDRMPVLLDPAAQLDWLDTPEHLCERLVERALRGPSVPVKAHRVSERVNRPRVDDASLIEPEEPAPPLQRDLWSP